MLNFSSECRLWPGARTWHWSREKYISRAILDNSSWRLVQVNILLVFCPAFELLYTLGSVAVFHLGHPENYLFLLSKNIFTASEYPKNRLFSKKASLALCTSNRLGDGVQCAWRLVCVQITHWRNLHWQKLMCQHKQAVCQQKIMLLHKNVSSRDV